MSGSLATSSAFKPSANCSRCRVCSGEAIDSWPKIGGHPKTRATTKSDKTDVALHRIKKILFSIDQRSMLQDDERISIRTRPVHYINLARPRCIPIIRTPTRRLIYAKIPLCGINSTSNLPRSLCNRGDLCVRWWPQKHRFIHFLGIWWHHKGHKSSCYLPYFEMIPCFLK